MLPTVKANMMMTFWLAATSAASQNADWSILYDLSGRLAATSQVVETSDGFLLVCAAFGNDSSQSHLVSASSSGGILGSRRIWPSLKRLSLVEAAAVPGAQGYDLLGTAQDTLSTWSIVRYRVSESGAPLDSALFELPGTSWISFDNALRLASGDLIVPAARTGTGEPPFARMRLMRFGSDGALMASGDFVNPFNMLLSRGIAEIAPDTFILATDAGFVELDQWGNWGAFTEFSTDLEPISGFGQLIVTGAPEPLYSNSFWSAHSVHPLPSGDLILSGRYASHGAVARTSRQGQLQSVFIPEGVEYSNYPAVQGGITMIGNGKVLFTLHEHFGQNINDIWAPFEPNVVKVYHLDTLLNTECVLTIDGAEENAFHWVSRTVATSDGGFILVGGKLDFDEQVPRWRCWAQKYAAGACFTGFEAHEFPAQVRAFPNPGSTEVNFCLNGPERGAYVEMFDLQGRIVGSTLFRMGQARLDAGEWPAGLYGYRVMGGDGTPLSAGRWVKE